MRCVSTVAVNCWQSLQSFADREPPKPEGVQSADAYRVSVRWRALAERLKWEDFGWAQPLGLGGSPEQVVSTWLERVGLEALPQPIGWALLMIDTALLMLWDHVPAHMAMPPALDKYPMFNANKGSTCGMVHHDAWLPLALLMALTGEDCAGFTVFPFNLMVSTPSASAHLRLSALCSQPVLPLPVSAEDRMMKKKMYGCWELVKMTSERYDLSTLRRPPKGRLFYSNSYFAAQVCMFGGAFYLAYSGKWHFEDEHMYHICLCNSPMACLEVVENSGKGFEVSARSRDTPLRMAGCRPTHA
eukprot:scaffold84278_cov35-Tisochrysis_lutea.AAC.5